jgi:hypothetical protein
VNRQVQTQAMQNRWIWLGVDKHYGGFIGQLYGSDRTVPLLQEHGGAGLQLSLWGYTNETTGRTGSNCDASDPTAAHEWNPMQASGNHDLTDTNHNQSCNWDLHPTEDLGSGLSYANGAWSINTKQEPGDFHKKGFFPGLMYEQTVTVPDSEPYAKITYAVSYTGSDLTGFLDRQESPAIHTANGISHYGYYKLANSNDVTRIEMASNGGQHQIALNTTDGWWGACDSTETHCVTIASFQPGGTSAQFDLSVLPAWEDGLPKVGYLTLRSYFNMTDGTSSPIGISIYVFPYKWDTAINGMTVKQRIDYIRTHQ